MYKYFTLDGLLEVERMEEQKLSHYLFSLEKDMEFRKLIADVDFAISVLCDHWNRKEENKSIIPHFQFNVPCLEGSSTSLNSSDDDAFSSYTSSSSCSPVSLASSMSSLLSGTELVEQQAPVKKGLSKFYRGKSRTFSSLSDVKCIEDLAKGDNSWRKKESGKSLSPKATISKKLGRSSFATLHV